MANEAVVTDLLGNGGDVIQFTCVDGTAIAKGTILELQDLRTVKKMSATDKPLAGIAAMEKVANDGSTTISAYTNCIVKATCSGAGITVGGQCVGTGADNQIKALDTLDAETGDVIGYALETVANGETFLMRVQK